MCLWVHVFIRLSPSFTSVAVSVYPVPSPALDAEDTAVSQMDRVLAFIRPGWVEGRQRKKRRHRTRVTSEGDKEGLRWNVGVHLDQEVGEQPLQAGGIGAEARRTRRKRPSKAVRESSHQREERAKL